MPPREDNPISANFLDSSDARPEPEPLEPAQPVTIRDWLAKKRKTDDIGDDSLWRIHDDLYDFTDFMDKVSLHFN